MLPFYIETLKVLMKVFSHVFIYHISFPVKALSMYVLLLFLFLIDVENDAHLWDKMRCFDGYVPFVMSQSTNISIFKTLSLV